MTILHRAANLVIDQMTGWHTVEAIYKGKEVNGMNKRTVNWLLAAIVVPAAVLALRLRLAKELSRLLG